MTERAQNSVEPAADPKTSAPTATIYRAMLDAILDRRLSAGMKLSEEQLAGIFSVSRTIVRAVLQRLSFEGLVSIERNRGAFVARPSIEEARQVFQARAAIEVAITRLLAANLSAHALMQLKAHIKKEREAHVRSDIESAVRLSGDFHLLMAALAGNDVLRRFLVELVSRTSLIISVYGRRTASSCSADEHEALLAALQSGDPQIAAGELEAHLRHVQERIDLMPPVNMAPDLEDIFGMGRR